MAEQPPRRRTPRVEDHAPWKPVPYDPADAVAMQALYAGRADAEQQKRALAWIIERAAATYEQSYRPGGDGGDRDTVFAEGRRFVGNSVVKLLKLSRDILKRR